MLVAKETGQDFEPVEAGTHFARTVGVIDLGTQRPNNPQFGEKRKVMLEWELPNERYENEGKDCPRRISATFTLSLSKNASLRKHLESWRGRPFTKEELEGFDMANLLGVPATLSVVHKESNGKTYANVASISKLPKGTALPEQFWGSVKYDLEQGKDKVFEQLPEWVQKRINSCVEWNPAVQTQRPENNVANHSEAEPDVDCGNDDSGVPF